MKLLMLNVLADDVIEIPTRLDIKMLIFKIAFADLSSNAKSNKVLFYHSSRYSSMQFACLKMI
jgi:hypothetical protein